MPSVRGIVRERAAQGTVEYALTVFALLALILGMAGFWGGGGRGGGPPHSRSVSGGVLPTPP